MIPEGMPDTSKPLPPEFFIISRCPSSAAPGVHAADPDVDVIEAGKSPPAVEVGLGTQYDSPVKVTRENEELDASCGN